MLAEENVITVSVDEKTGIQALERISPDKPTKQGMIEKREFEYKRHGTLSLTPSFNIVTSDNELSYRCNEVDFLHIKQTVATPRKVPFDGPIECASKRWFDLSQNVVA